MKDSPQKEILVYADWDGLAEPTKIGALSVSLVRGKEIFSFEYDKGWLESPSCQALDPDLALYAGPQYVPKGGRNFGIFLDSAPDRWGRTLMERHEAQRARAGNRKPNRLLESDILLGVFDEHRMGALRFRTNSAGAFLDDDKHLASPPWTSLSELQHASLELERKDVEEDKNFSKWINMLVAPGSSLGGARPKASVCDKETGLWIAKFPSRNDRIDVGAWEKLVNDLAAECKIDVPPSRIEKFSDDFHTFLARRFDRTRARRRRRHFASALTLLQRADGDDFSKGASYLELVDFLVTHGSKPADDLAQLWRRIVFFIGVSNTDDHLRNHGFLFDGKGWRLAPAYDMNPAPDSNGLTLNISETDNAQDLDLAREVAPLFRVKPKDMEKIISEISRAIHTWRGKASKLGIPRPEQDRMESAFRM